MRNLAIIGASSDHALLVRLAIAAQTSRNVEVVVIESAPPLVREIDNVPLNSLKTYQYEKEIYPVEDDRRTNKPFYLGLRKYQRSQNSR